MSKLYEAIKKIEEKEKKRDGLPDFVERKRRPPYLLMVVSTLFVAVVVFSGLYFTSRFERMERSGFLKRRQHIVKGNVVRSEKVLDRSLVVKKETRVKSVELAETHIKKKPLQKKIAQKKESMSDVVNFRKTITTKGRKTKNNTLVKSHAVVSSGGGRKVVNKEVKKALPEKSVKQNQWSQDQTAELLKKASSGNFFESVNAYRKLIKLYPNNISLYNNLAVRFMERGLYWKAVKVLKEGLNIKDDPTLKLNLAICYVKLGRYDKAKAIVNTIPSGSVNSEELKKIKYYLSNINN